MADLIVTEWKSQLEQDSNAVVLDVRTPAECDEGVIPNAILLDLYSGQEFIDGLDQFDKAKSYYVYCRSGVRSAQACSIMKQLGFNKAYNLMGGILAWDGEIVR